ncbi:beta-lactamase/transpeptidase-like protein [Fusarium oxysporum]|nr:beta-lactamase/transpeptidase-like protein [Fusarium oxysporum]
MNYLALALSLGLATIPQQANAQETPCPLLGAIFPPVQHPLKSSAFSDTIAQLNATFNELDRNGTLEGFNTTFYIQAFSASDTLFQHGYVPPSMKGFLTSGSLNEDTVFRVGSVSKLLTVYTLLAEVGMKRMNDPVTKWVPELAHAARKNKGDPTRKVQWDEVTIGQLSGHLAGISRNFGFFDISSVIESTNQNPELYGLPILNKKEKPHCSVSDPSLRPCSRKEFFQGITAPTFLPITSTANTPVYSNVAYQILTYALEGMTRKPFKKSFQSSLLHPLSMKRTSLEAPGSKENAMIPENEQLSWWNVTTADGSPYGGMFSTAADLTRLGQSILNSSILSPSETRSWMKPITHTADVHMSVGMPWEIRRTYIPLGRSGARVVDLYTKNGAIGLYTAIFVLSPDHEIGYVALIAGANRAYLLSYLPDLLAQTLLPAAENAARDTAVKRLAGPFKGPKSQLTVTMDDTLVVRNWTRGDVDVIATQAALTWPGLDVTTVLRLYPVGLEGNKRMSFRGVFEARAVGESTAEAETNATDANIGPFSGGCLSWGGVDSLTYGNIGVDDFEFEVDGDGNATGLTPRVMRETLEKVC